MTEIRNVTKVNTVLGPISPDDLGTTLMHEHVLFGWPGWYGDVTIGAFDREAALAKAIGLFEELKALGLRTYVDATTNETGRNPELLREISEKTGINIICSTGYYTEARGGSAYFKGRSGFGDVLPEIYEMFMAEITEGIGRTGIKAGAIKLASGNGAISPYEQMFFKAAAKAQRETGIPIITHTDFATMGPEQAELLVAEGADPKRVLIGHMGDNTELRYHLRTLAQGVYVGFDRMGIQGVEGRPMDTERYAVLVGLIRSNYTDRLILSHDYCMTMLGRPLLGVLEKYPVMANHHPTHIFKRVIPALREMGVTETQIHTLLVDNPRRLFAGA